MRENVANLQNVTMCQTQNAKNDWYLDRSLISPCYIVLMVEILVLRVLEDKSISGFECAIVMKPKRVEESIVQNSTNLVCSPGHCGTKALGCCADSQLQEFLGFNVEMN